MNYNVAMKLLPRFQTLLDSYSPSYGEKVVDLFVGYEDERLTRQMYWWSRRVTSYAGIPSEQGKYTLCVAVESRRIASVRKVVEADRNGQFSEVLNELPYLEKYDEMSGYSHS